ncbi:hypothetical protein BGX34_006906 [Mortierella sp. NVP85]|nr:hypothetical protein BGX34_006906 [Mortierella sp. NVP85]
MAKAKGKRPAPAKKFDGGGSRIEAVNTWDEMEGDSEDEFHDSRQAILLDHEKELERRLDDEYEGSEEEVFGLEGDEDDEDEEDEDDLDGSDDDLGNKEDEEDVMDLDKASWGKSKRSYYDAEEIESDEETAKAEEEEALRLQKKRIAEMSEEDFAPEEDDTAWGAATGRGIMGDKDADRALVEGFEKELDGIDLLKAEQGGVVVEKIAKAGVSKLSKQEILKVLQNQSPELLDLVEEFKEKTGMVQAIAELLQLTNTLSRPYPEDKMPMPFLRLKYQTFINYLTNISFYIALKTSPEATSTDLTNHPVIDALYELKKSIDKLERMEKKKTISKSMQDLLEILENDGEDNDDQENGEDEEEMRRLKKEEVKTRKAAKKTKKSKAESAGKLKSENSAPRTFEYNVDYEDDFVSYNKKAKKTGKSIVPDKKRRAENDYGDLDELLDVDLEDKAQKKRSLRDYVAKLDQKANKRSKILRGSGDSDIPYREKFKDRQEQMKRQAVKSAPAPENTELDDLEWDARDMADARRVTDGDDDMFGGDGGSKRSGQQQSEGEDYYQEVVNAKEAKKAARRALSENLEKSTSFEDTSMDPNDKRSVSWQILKNKGLTPHRKKEQRNPRVKNRNRYEAAKKKIKSVKRVFTRLEGAYGGEKTGIKTGLARSVKFS